MFVLFVKILFSCVPVRYREHAGVLVCVPDRCREHVRVLVCVPDRCREHAGVLVCVPDRCREHVGALVCVPDRCREHVGVLVCVPDRCREHKFPSRRFQKMSATFSSCAGLNASEAMYSNKLWRNWAAAGRVFKSCCKSALQTNSFPLPTLAS